MKSLRSSIGAAVIIACTAAHAQDGVATPIAAIKATIPTDLSPWNMFLTADPIVKAIMITLASASIVTWCIGFAKAIELRQTKRRLRSRLPELRRSDLLATRASASIVKASLFDKMRSLVRFELDASIDLVDKRGTLERISAQLKDLELEAVRRMRAGTGPLATIGATAPFVGLLGTVWGIMNSFIGISKAQTTNLAVVAPGIAEALLATAIGLAAAIPAVVIYNLLSRATQGYRALVHETARAFEQSASRELDRQASGRPMLQHAAE